MLAVRQRRAVRYLMDRLRVRRFTTLAGCRNGDETIHGMSSSQPPKFLSNEQVGKVIANQFHNRTAKLTRRHPHRLTPQEATRYWTVSTLYKLMSIPSWVVSPYRKILPDDPSHSTGPIIVDRLKTWDEKYGYFGSFGQNINIVCLDGKHRLAEHNREHGDSEIEAYVGTEAIRMIDDWLKEFGAKRKRFVEALESFYDNPQDRGAWHRLIASGRQAGLNDDQLRLLWRNRLKGFRFDPALGEFMRMGG